MKSIRLGILQNFIIYEYIYFLNNKIISERDFCLPCKRVSEIILEILILKINS